MTSIQNSKGTVYYGMHFYSGVAEYQEPGKDPYRVFLNEDTIRAMDPSFAGRPVFVHHVEEVDTDLKALRNEADGWVVESFYNPADGKHWVKFIVVSEKGERAINKQGMRLSNCYIPKRMGNGGSWNGVPYNKEIVEGEYEHLAIVPNPRYEESVILTPEQFKKYNEDKTLELKRLANENEERKPMLNIFKREKVANSVDLESMSVELPKSKKEMTISKMVDLADKVTNGDHMLDVHGTKMTLNELLEKHKSMNDELEAFKKEKAMNAEKEKGEMEDCKNEDDEEKKKEKKENDDDTPDVPAQVSGGNSKKENEEDDEEEKKKKKENEAKEEEAKKNKKKNEAAAKAEALRNADKRQGVQVAKVEFSMDQVVRGKTRYGS